MLSTYIFGAGCYLRRRQPAIFLSGLLLTLGGCNGPTGPLTYDASPDAPNGGPPCSQCTAGVTVGLAGNNAQLFAVSADAGVWRSSNSSEGALTASEWYQLPAGPPRAFSIAVDPNNSSHLAVGQRDGDQIANNDSGVRESFDAGETWPNYFDPSATPLNCQAQGISSVAFSRRSTLFFSTACGIGVRQTSQATASYPALPTGTTAISAVTASETKLWARTADGTVLVSTTEGASWTLATQKPLPTSANDFSTRGDSTSLGAWDNYVFMSSMGANRIVNGAEKNNFNQLTILDVTNDQWIVQSRIDNSVNGEGAGGRRQVKSFIFGTNERVGADRQLYFSSAQEIYRATAQNSDGTLKWEKIAATWSSGAAPTHEQFANIIHNDLWDFNVANGGSDVWIGSDGGIVQNTPAKKGWVLRNQGLHTQHIHTLYTPDPDLHLAYPTHDNDAWFRISPGIWRSESSLGDASWTSGDAGNPTAALLARQTGPCSDRCYCGEVVQFENNGKYKIKCVLINQNPTFGDGASIPDGPGSIVFVPTLVTEGNPAPKLDALLLTPLPLTYDSGNGKTAIVKGPPGISPPAQGNALVILRNPQYLEHPEIDSSAQGWSIFANNLPAGTHKFWVAGGHARPILFLLANQNGQEHLYRGTGMQPPSVVSGWTELNVQGNGLQPQPWPTPQILAGALNGPVFVNPWNSQQLYVLTQPGVMYSFTGGFSFTIDQALTNLVNGQGKFPMTGDFSGSTPLSGPVIDFGNSYISAHMGTLSAVAFNRESINERVAASPFSGLFYSPGNGIWTDLSKALPKPASSVSDVGLVGDQLYVTTEGRGVLNIQQFRPPFRRPVTIFH
jgi:hypothetical protein